MLAALLNVPKNDDEWAIFSFHHRASHQAIRQAIAKQHNTILPDYPLDPIPFFAFQDWLKSNQSAHQDMDSVLGSQSSDIEDLNPLDERELQAWVFLHYVEHQTAEKILGIGS
jgi:hypothetical protein